MTTTWNSSDKSSNITLSGGSLVATLTSASAGGVRTTASVASGKIYYEVICLVNAGTLMAIGWANSTSSLTTQVGGTDKNSWAYFFTFSAGQINFNNASLGTVGTAPALSTIGVAYDIGGKLVWVRVNGGPWNNSATADPATGTGGKSVSTINAGPYFPIFQVTSGSGASILANFGATDFGYAAPSGFSGIDSDAQNYAAVSKLLSYSVLMPPQDSVLVSKLLGYSALSPPQNATVVSKLLGYAVIIPNTGLTADASFTLADDTLSGTATEAIAASGSFTADMSLSGSTSTGETAEALALTLDTGLSGEIDTAGGADGSLTLDDFTLGGDGGGVGTADASMTFDDFTLAGFATAPGSAMFSGDISFSLESSAIAFDRRANIVFMFRNNWAGDVTERLEWLTDVMTSISGSEQRRAARLSPRRFFEFDVLVTDRDKTHFELFLRTVGDDPFGLPVWHDGTVITETRHAGDTDLPCSTVGREFVVDGYALILKANRNDQGARSFGFEWVKIAAIADDTLTIYGGLSFGRTPGTMIFPLVIATLAGNDSVPKTTRRSTQVNTATVSCRVVGPNDWAPEPTFEMYGGFPVLGVEPNEADDMDYDYDREDSTFDSDTGAVYTVDTGGRAFRQQQFNWFLHGAQEHADFRSLLYYLRGKARSIWVPSFTSDFTLAGTAGPTDQTIAVDYVGLGDFGGRGWHIQIDFRDGTHYRGAILAANHLVDMGTENLVLDTPFGAEVTSDTVRRIMFLSLCRQDQDAFEIQHKSDQRGLSIATTTFREFNNARDGSGDNYVPIAHGDETDGACGDHCIPFVERTPQMIMDFATGNYSINGIPTDVDDMLTDIGPIVGGTGFKITNRTQADFKGDAKTFALARNYMVVADFTVNRNLPDTSFYMPIISAFLDDPDATDGSIEVLAATNQDSPDDSTPVLEWEVFDSERDILTQGTYASNAARVAWTVTETNFRLTGRGMLVQDEDSETGTPDEDLNWDTFRIGPSYGEGSSADTNPYAVKTSGGPPWGDEDFVLGLKSLKFYQVIPSIDDMHHYSEPSSLSLPDFAVHSPAPDCELPRVFFDFVAQDFFSWDEGTLDLDHTFDFTDATEDSAFFLEADGLRVDPLETGPVVVGNPSAPPLIHGPFNMIATPNFTVVVQMKLPVSTDPLWVTIFDVIRRFHSSIYLELFDDGTGDAVTVWPQEYGESIDREFQTTISPRPEILKIAFTRTPNRVSISVNGAPVISHTEVGDAFMFPNSDESVTVDFGLYPSSYADNASSVSHIQSFVVYPPLTEAAMVRLSTP